MATFESRVVAVADGDSLVVASSADGTLGEQRVRLEGIDAPEFGQQFHQQSKKFLADACLGKTVVVEPREKDRYGRLVARVFLNQANSKLSPENDMSRRLLYAGMAWHFLRYNDDSDLAAAEAHARSRQIGLWQDPDAVAPWVWRDQPTKRK